MIIIILLAAGCLFYFLLKPPRLPGYNKYASTNRFRLNRELRGADKIFPLRSRTSHFTEIESQINQTMQGNEAKPNA